MELSQILIVDDNEENLYFLRALLQGYGHKVISAPHGASALDAARHNPPDLVIADILMPVMDGFALCREWKKDKRLKSIPFVFYTATYTDERDREFAISLGAERFIVMPEEPEAFMAIIREIMQQVAKQRPAHSISAADTSNKLPAEELAEEHVFLRQYNDALIRKLETKMEQLEQVNRKLEKDIAMRQTAESALRESERRLAITIDAAQLGTFDWNLLTGQVIWNARYAELFGLSREEFDGTVTILEQQVHPEDKPILRQAIARCQQDRSLFYQEFRTIRRNGSIHWISASGRFTYDEANGRPLRMHGVVADIEERKGAETERERLMTAVENAGEIILITDTAGIIEYVNPVFERVTGYARREVLGQNPSILNSGQQSESFYRQLWETVSRGLIWKGRLINKRKNGMVYTEDETISPIRNAAGRITNYVAVKRDITEQLRLTEQMQQAQKMEAVGRLAGGVAHDINNILTVILGYAELAMNGMDNADPLHDKLEEILKSAKRSKDMIRQLLAFARKQAVTPEVLDLNSTVEGMLKMLRLLIGEDIDLAWMPGSGLPSTRMDPGQIDQILANLCINARDAIRNIGKITIETGKASFDQAYCNLHRGFVPGEFVLLAVSDNGCGMDRDTIAKIFEPFFTTKRLGTGTGLGLATVYGIVKQNEGFINVYSEPGKGTTFRIYLKPYFGQASAIRKEIMEDIPRGHGETVLVTEDDPSILKLASTMLHRFGYTVLTANAPAQAIQIAEASSDRIRLLITDIIMPEMNGRELAERLRLICPEMKCLLMSGYTADAVGQHGLLDEGALFLPKPFSTKELATKIREALDHPRVASV